jgi:hypothetical protein
MGLLMAIGFIDLVATALLHRYGLIVELNPLMRPLIERSEWLFAVVKGGTLVTAWIMMARYASANLAFVRKVCLAGSGAYVTIWTVWFFGAMAV